MSNEVSIFADGSQLPAHLIGATDGITDSLASGAASGKRISIKGGVFRMMVAGKEVAINDARELNIVIVAAAPTNNRQYYEGTYVDGVATSPDCYSVDSRTPAADAKNRQASTCAACPQNIKGSGQGDSRACRYQRRLAVVLEGDMSGEVYQLALPATSIFGQGDQGKKLPLQAYADHLKVHNAAVTAVVTEMKFDTTVSTPKLTFRAIRPLNREEYDLCIEQGASADAKRAIELTVTQTDGVVSTPAPAVVQAPAAKTGTGFVKVAAVEDGPDEAIVEVVAEPVKVKTASKTVADRPSIAEVLADFESM